MEYGDLTAKHEWKMFLLLEAGKYRKKIYIYIYIYIYKSKDMDDHVQTYEHRP